MRNKFRYFPLFFLLLAPLLVADMGPKPTAEFEIEYAIDPVPTLTNYVLLECADPKCTEAAPLEEFGPQRFECTQEACSSMAYGYPDTMQISLTFSDGVTRTSNPFGKKHFNAEYRITVRADELVVKETGGSANPYTLFLIYILAVSCLVILGVIGAIVLIVRAVRKKRRTAQNVIESE